MLLSILLAAVLSSDPAAFVRSLYEANQRDEPDAVYGVKSRDELRRTFDGPIVDLIWRDLVDAQGDVGRMDGHYLYDAQDSEIANLQIRTVENGGGKARVVATFDYPSGSRSAEFRLTGTKDGWRIENIHWGDANYIDVLQADFPLPLVKDERAEKAVCGMYESYKVTVPEGWDANEEALELAEMFANGNEVEQDFSAALHFICRASLLADADRWSMLEHVLLMERGQIEEPLDFCNHQTSSHGGIVCAGRHSTGERPQLEARYETIREKAGKAIEPLRERADAFISADSHYDEEEYRGGTMASYIGTYTTIEREKKFLELLELYSSERAPAASQADFKRADAELNAAYRKHMDGIAPCDAEYVSCEGPSQKDNFKAAQRAWIPYRDAWIAYYQERWRGKAPPEVLKREIATAITKARTAELTAPRAEE